MKAAVVSQERRLVVDELEDPELLPGSVRLKVDRCGICGSDLHLRHDERIVAPGAVLGHEIVGSILEVGEGVTAWTSGQRVASYHAVSCGECERCRTNRPHMCAKALQLSLGLGTVQGGYAERIVVPETLLHAIPDHISFDEAALTEPLAIGLHGVNKARVEPGEDICILGAGPIGAMAAWALRTRGVDNIVLVDPNPHRRAAIQAMGFAAVDLDSVADSVVRVLGRQPHVVFEASGHVTSPGLAVELVGPSGRVVLQGRPPAPVAIDQRLVVSKEVSVVGAVNCTEDDFSEALGHIAAGKLELADLVTDVIALDEADAMFDTLLSPAHTSGKVLLAP
jgi:2-desacetyl-2-hydroxyethyl bacteriochlorophyllide A dehydrogenase